MKTISLILVMILIMAAVASAESYIIEFKDQSSLEKYNELTAQNQRYINKYNSMFFLNPVRLYYKFFLIKNEKQLEEETRKYDAALNKTIDSRVAMLQQQYGIPDSAIGDKFTKGFPGVVVNIDIATSQEIKTKPYVKSVIPNIKLSTMLNDTVILMNITQAWQIQDSAGKNLNGQGVKIAVIDTGFDLTRPAFTGINVIQKQCYCSQDEKGCCPDGSKAMSGDAALTDNNGHGTFVLGILASNDANFKGIAPNAQYMLVKIANQTETATTEDFLKALQFVIDPNNDGNYNDRADVLSLSLGAIAKELYDQVVAEYQGYGLSNDEIKQAVIDYFEPMNRVIGQASKLGVTVVAAAGNHPNDGYITAFAMIDEPIIVGALTKDNQLAKYSSWGPAFNGFPGPDVLATGGCTFNCLDFSLYGSLDNDGKISYLRNNSKLGIRSVKSSSVVCMVKTQTGDCLDNAAIFGKTDEIYTYNNGNFVSLEGTSFAAAVVSGIVALIHQKHPDWTPDMMQAAIKSTADSLGLDPNKQGAGKVDILKALNKDFTCSGADFNTDPMNCGKCGNACTGTYNCVQGVCEFCGDSVCNGQETYQTCGQDCKQCTPQCNGNVCGSDGCGGTCGSCSDGSTCNAGKCLTTLKGIRVNCTSGVCYNFTLDTIPSACSGLYNQTVNIYQGNYSDNGGVLVSTYNTGNFTLQVNG